MINAPAVSDQLLERSRLPGTDQLGAYLDTSGSPIARSEFDAPELVGGDVARRNALI